jgi:hypothetical protein
MARRMRAWAAVCMQRELHRVRQSTGKTTYIVASKGSGGAKESPPSYVCLENGGSRGRGGQSWTNARRVPSRIGQKRRGWTSDFHLNASSMVSYSALFTVRSAGNALSYSLTCKSVTGAERAETCNKSGGQPCISAQHDAAYNGLGRLGHACKLR